MDIFRMAIGKVASSRLRRCSRQGERCSRYLSMFSLSGYIEKFAEYCYEYKCY